MDAPRVQRLTPRQPQRSAPSRSTAHPPFPLPGASAPCHYGSAWHPCVFESIRGLNVCFKIKIPSQNARKMVTPGHGKSRLLTPSPPLPRRSFRAKAGPPSGALAKEGGCWFLVVTRARQGEITWNHSKSTPINRFREKNDQPKLHQPRRLSGQFIGQIHKKTPSKNAAKICNNHTFKATTVRHSPSNKNTTNVTFLSLP
jgi:hypothetical protein